jgi:hypothetical protein
MFWHKEGKGYNLEKSSNTNFFAGRPPTVNTVVEAKVFYL